MASANTVGNRKRYRGRVRAELQSIKRHLDNLVRDSKQARTRCMLVPAIQAGGVYPSGLLDANVEGVFSSTSSLIALLLSRKMSAGPTCLSAGAFGP